MNKRASAPGTPSGFVHNGICRNNSARNGSRSETHNASPSRLISISNDFFERGEQEMAVQLLNVELGAFAHDAPQNRTFFMMKFEHMSHGIFCWITEHDMDTQGLVG